jgi:EAL domain-containing protein (putative c-di-GMP-specific phosphodiesterase class I)
VIAEGVETQEQRDRLALYGCKVCQGYLFHQPLPLPEFEMLLSTPFTPRSENASPEILEKT